MGTIDQIRTLLIANRGEIACRIARTARRLGIRTVAVYSDADAGALHVRECDVAVRIGRAASAESYLSSAAILSAGAATGADAIHPGYGFLSENAEFAEACESAGLIFVGPPPAAIRAMGLKAAAKSLMGAAGVPLTPGYHGKDQSAAHLKQEAAKIGFPVLIKASAGGGGKGMRRVDRLDEFDQALASCKRESIASFGNEAVIIERYLLKPRHVEVQIFADRHNHCVSLFERDCSVQRRHQKVLEEAPAPGLSESERAQMFAAAIAAARAVAYVGAGTVEFIRAQTGEFYFMEMNTRLQVEHPVTEMITGLDLVEWQLRVAAGESLPLLQTEITCRGHAFEARIYAEDPARGFLPATGELTWFAQPPTSDFVRVDSGVAVGDVISPFYDPMIAKLIVHDVDRPSAVRRLQAALASVEIAGVANNVDFLRRLAHTHSFVTAAVDTDLIAAQQSALVAAPSGPSADALLTAVAALLADERLCADGNSPWAARDGWRLQARASRVLTFTDALVNVRYGVVTDELTIGSTTFQARATKVAPNRYRMTIDGRVSLANVVRTRESVVVFLPDAHETLTLTDPLTPSAPVESQTSNLRAPMPGRVVALHQTEGATVAKGEPLLVMEAMKMEHMILAPTAGRVVAYRYAVGDQVVEGAELVHLEPIETLQ